MSSTTHPQLAYCIECRYGYEARPAWMPHYCYCLHSFWCDVCQHPSTPDTRCPHTPLDSYGKQLAGSFSFCLHGAEDREWYRSKDSEALSELLEEMASYDADILSKSELRTLLRWLPKSLRQETAGMRDTHIADDDWHWVVDDVARAIREYAIDYLSEEDKAHLFGEVAA